MEIGRARGHPAPGGTHEEALLDQVGLDHVFDGTPLLAYGRCQAVHPHRATVEFADHRLQQASVHHVEAGVVHVEHGKGRIRHLDGEPPVGLDLGSPSALPLTAPKPVLLERSARPTRPVVRAAKRRLTT